MMADHRLDLAEALLAKARSTTFEGERESFVAGAYGQLGAFLGTERAVPARPALPSAGGHTTGRPAAALAGGDRRDPGTRPSPPAVVDLAAAERAYRGAGADRARTGVLIDLTI